MAYLFHSVVSFVQILLLIAPTDATHASRIYQAHTSLIGERELSFFLSSLNLLISRVHPCQHYPQSTRMPFAQLVGLFSRSELSSSDTNPHDIPRMKIEQSITLQTLHAYASFFRGETSSSMPYWMPVSCQSQVSSQKPIAKVFRHARMPETRLQTPISSKAENSIRDTCICQSLPPPHVPCPGFLEQYKYGWTQRVAEN